MVSRSVDEADYSSHLHNASSTGVFPAGSHTLLPLEHTRDGLHVLQSGLPWVGAAQDRQGGLIIRCI